MKQFYAISAVAKDKPGIVADVTGLIYESGCNLEDSGMTILENFTAFLAIVSGDGEALADRLNNGAKRLEWDKGIVVFVSPVRDIQAQREAAESVIRYELSTIGLDRAGIVYRISRILADRGVNIAELRTHTEPSPETGTPLFNMVIILELVEGVEVPELEEELNRAGEELNVDIHLAPAMEPPV